MSPTAPCGFDDRPKSEQTFLIISDTRAGTSNTLVLQSLYQLFRAGLLCPDLKIVCAAPAEYGDAYLQAFHEVARDDPVGCRDEAQLARFLEQLSYAPLSSSRVDSFAKLTEKIGNRLTGLSIFLSSAPDSFESTVDALKSAGLNGENVRIGLETFHGGSLESARRYNDAIAEAFPEDRIFRIDYYLGKETVQNLMALRFANLVFEPLWNSVGIDHVQITISESSVRQEVQQSLEEIGALRGMAENHMLQLLALTAMEPPTTYDSNNVRDEMLKVLRALKQVDIKDVVLGRDTFVHLDAKAFNPFQGGPSCASETETFVALKVGIDNWRWKGVPFYLRTGKRLALQRSEIIVQFNRVPHNIFGRRGGSLFGNRLEMRLEPEEYVRLHVMAKAPGLLPHRIALREIPLDLSLADRFPKSRRRVAYERLLLDLVQGEQTLFVRRDEVEAQWRWLDAICRTCADGQVELKPYASGSWGPSAAVALIERDGRSWHD